MSFFDKLRTQKLLSFTLILFTLSVGIVIGTLINSGVKAAKDNPAAPGATPLVIPNPVELSNRVQPDRQAGRAFGGEYFHRRICPRLPPRIARQRGAASRSAARRRRTGRRQWRHGRFPLPVLRQSLR